MSSQQRAKLVEQRAEFLEQVESLRTAVQRQMSLTKQNPLAEEMASDFKSSSPDARTRRWSQEPARTPTATCSLLLCSALYTCEGLFPDEMTVANLLACETLINF